MDFDGSDHTRVASDDWEKINNTFPTVIIVPRTNIRLKQPHINLEHQKNKTLKIVLKSEFSVDSTRFEAGNDVTAP